MTDDRYTALMLIIDRSGSMAAIRDEMVGSLHTMLREQAGEPGTLTVDIVTFDDRIETPQVFADPASVRIELEPRGMTALLDAIGSGVSALGARLEGLPEHARPGTVIVVVATDGLENASREWTQPRIKALIDEQRDRYGWDFVFLGADQDAITTGGRLGFAPESSIDFDADGFAASAVVASAGAYLTTRRATGAAAFSTADRSAASRRRR